MKQIFQKVFIDDRIFKDEYDYLYGDKKNEEVVFWYVNQKTDKSTPKNGFTYQKALDLARKRARDGRYKNYAYEITAK